MLGKGEMGQASTERDPQVQAGSIAVTNTQRIIEEWINTAKELGRPIPAPRGRLMYA
jgi:hypothetical protein